MAFTSAIGSGVVCYAHVFSKNFYCHLILTEIGEHILATMLNIKFIYRKMANVMISAKLQAQNTKPTKL